MTAPLEVGETFQYAFQAYDSAGAPIAPATVTASVERPDGTSVPLTPSGVSPALVDYVLEQEGRHVLSGTATGGALGTAVEKFTDVFHAEAPGRYVIGVDEARSRLRMLGLAVTPDDVEALRWCILNASDAVELDLGRAVARRTITERYDRPLGSALALRSSPVLAVSSVTVDGAPWTLDTHYVRSGRFLCRGTSTSRLSWPAGLQHIAVTYTVGMVPVPPVIRGVVADVMARTWQTRSADHPFVGDATDNGAVFEAVTTLSSVELAAYERLRDVGGMA